MDNKQNKTLATAIAHWLAYKRLSGFGQVLSESLLVMPIAEFLLGNRYTIAAEQDLKKTFDIDRRESSEVSYDIVGRKLSAKVLFEIKFLKQAKDQRLLYDLTKLA